ncbi:hypothetical protein [Pelagibius marinus]|uniref:hypothetical protein n=1 Tax=Pelagibius marinus TaxID=2762760 RepID=UPI001872F95D|nr:hypothetical protein [Pelagibius marinus]
MQVLFFVALLLPLGLWLLWRGWSEGVWINLAIGGTFLFVAAVVFAALYYSSRTSRRRHRRKLAEGTAAEVDLPLGVGARRRFDRKAQPGDDNASSVDPIDADGGGLSDIDVGGFD